MLVSDFDYNLPEALIARHPLPSRSASRLLQLNRRSGVIAHHTFKELDNLLAPGDLLIFNQTKVIPARLFARKETGGKLELLVERVLDQGRLWAHVKASHAPKVGATLYFENGARAEIKQREKGLTLIQLLNHLDPYDLMDDIGHTPIPPYFERDDALEDKTRYQTVYATDPGAVAAPTAGLHFDAPMMEALARKGINTAYLTLHVGAGTFQPIRTERTEDHVMHAERYTLPSETVDKINATKAAGHRVIAVGTTSVRTLEGIASKGKLCAETGETRLFITPGFEFKIVDGLLTNFHLPKSTLLMLVSAFATHKAVRAAYDTAIQEKYRFFSYGDCMLLL